MPPLTKTQLCQNLSLFWQHYEASKQNPELYQASLHTYPSLCTLLNTTPTTNSLQRKRQFHKWATTWDIKQIGRKYKITLKTPTTATTGA